MPGADRLAQLAEEYRDLQRQGRSVPLEEFGRPFPDLLPALRELLAEDATVDAGRESERAPTLDWNASSPPPDSQATAAYDPDRSSPAAGPPGQQTQAGEATLDAGADRGAAVSFPELPGFEILEELGRGGMGVVYKARQVSLRRLVALKMILAGSGAGAEERDRFRSEAEAVAQLQHPHIVAIHEIGDHQGLPFFSLEFVAGGSLAQSLRRTPPTPRQAAQLVLTLARAVQHAHQRGIVHRDLKPANVLLQRNEDEAGATQASPEHWYPKIADFGLAKMLREEDSGRTRSGAILGTPSYMAPEQAEGKSEHVGPLVDVYALGAILYELLTERPPFQGGSVMSTLQQVVAQEVVPPSKRKPGIDRDLETICLKALAKEPARRYASALALAQDLERYLAGEPILARRIGPLGRAWRTLRRRKLTVGLVLALVAAVSVAALIFVGAGDARRLAALHRAFDRKAEEDRWDPARRAELESLIEQMEALDPGQVEAARQRLRDRFVEWFQARLRQPRLLPEEADGLRAALGWLESQDPERAASLEEALVRRLRDWQVLFDLQGAGADPAEVFASARIAKKGETFQAVSPKHPTPDDMWLGTAATRIASGGRVRVEAVFDPSWAQAASVGLFLNLSKGHAGPIQDLAFSPDGKLLASTCFDLRLWETATGKLLHVVDLPQHPGPVVFSPDGKTLAVGTTQVVLVDPAKGAIRTMLPLRHAGRILALAFTRDGKRLASSAGDRRLFVQETDPAIPAPPAVPMAEAPVARLAFHEDSRRLIGIDANRRVVEIDPANGKTLRSFDLPGPGSWQRVALAPDGRHIGLSHDRQTRLFDVGTGQPVPQPVFSDFEPAVLTFGRDGRTLVGGGGRTFRVALGGSERNGFEGTGVYGTNLTALAVDRDNRWLAVGLADGSLRIVDLATRRTAVQMGNQGYAFLLTTESDPGGHGGVKSARKPASPLGKVRARRGKGRLVILRNGKPQRQQDVSLPSGPLSLRAGREGDRLFFQLGSQAPLECFDPLPLSGPYPGVFGVLLPPGTGLTGLRGLSQPLPNLASPLEKADELFEKGDFPAAQELFREQARSGASPAVVQEAQAKAGLCLLQLGRKEDAVALLEKAAAAGDDRWALVATIHLWLQRLEENRLEDAEAYLTALSARFRPEHLQTYVPEDIRRRILSDYRLDPADHPGFDPKLLSRLRTTVALADLFDDQQHRVWSRYFLARGQLLLRRWDDAAETLRQSLELEKQQPERFSPRGTPYLLRWFAWVERLRGRAPEALAEMNAWLFETPGEIRSNIHGTLAPCLLDRARLHIALDRWQEAERDVDAYLATVADAEDRLKPRTTYAFYATACLLKGFLRERRGEAAEAVAAWKKGVYAEYCAAMPHEPSNVDLARKMPRGDSLILHILLGSLSNSIDEQEGKRILAALVEQVGSGSGAARFASLVRLPPDLFRQLFRRPQGKEYARQMAFLALDPVEYYRRPFGLTLQEVVRLSVFGDKLDDRRERLLGEISWNAVSDYFDGKVNQAHLLQLGLTWKGTTNFLGWGGLAPQLRPDLRAQAAWVLGHRFRKLNRPADAAMFFRTTLKDAAAGSELRTLAAEDLQLLEKK